jgi:hypothetical protein
MLMTLSGNSTSGINEIISPLVVPIDIIFKLQSRQETFDAKRLKKIEMKSINFERNMYDIGFLDLVFEICHAEFCQILRILADRLSGEIHEDFWQLLPGICQKSHKNELNLTTF